MGVPSLIIFAQIIEHWFPSYRSATGILVIFFGVAVLRVSDFWSSFLMVSGQEMRLLVLDCLVLAAGASIWIVLTPEHLSDLWAYGMLAALLAVGHYLATATMAWLLVRQPSTVAENTHINI